MSTPKTKKIKYCAHCGLELSLSAPRCLRCGNAAPLSRKEKLKRFFQKHTFFAFSVPIALVLLSVGICVGYLYAVRKSAVQPSASLQPTDTALEVSSGSRVDFDKINRTVISYKIEQGRATDRELEWLAKDTIKCLREAHRSKAFSPSDTERYLALSRTLCSDIPTVATAQKLNATFSTGAPAVAPALAKEKATVQDVLDAVETLKVLGRLDDETLDMAVQVIFFVVKDSVQYDNAAEVKKVKGAYLK